MKDYNLCIQVIPMPCNTNENGDIFGGWLLSQMDLAGCIECKNYYSGRYVTITIDKMVFKQPVQVGDLLSIYCKMINIGNTSITVDIISKIKKMDTKELIEVTRGVFKYVCIDNEKKPKRIKKLVL
jgi:acyl-CoA thioesterase YciA